MKSLMKEWRERMKITQPKAGELLGYKQRQIRYFDAKQKPIPKHTLILMRHLLDLHKLGSKPLEYGWHRKNIK